MNNKIRAVGLAVATGVFLLSSLNARAQSGTWTNTQSGIWSDANNWLNGIVATGANSIAYFNTIDLTADVTNSLDSPRTIGRLMFGDANTNTAAVWTLDDDGDTANILTFEGDTVQPGITVTNEATISAPLKFLGTTCDIDVSADGVLTLEGPMDTAGDTTLRKKGSGVLRVVGRYGTDVTKPASIFERGTVVFSGNMVYSRGISTPNGVGDVNIVANGATINGGGSIELQTVYSTGVFDMRGGSLTVNEIGMARAGNFGANESIATISGGAVVNASSGIKTGNRADTGGASSFVLKDGTVNAANGTILIGIRAGENFFTQLGGTVTSAELRLQYRMNVGEWNFASLYNLNAGILIVGSVVTGDDTANFVVNTAYFNFHGGTLKPAWNETDFFRTTITGSNAALAPPRVVVWSEGAVIDTGGKDIAIRQPLVGPTGAGLYADTNGNLTVFLSGLDAGSGYKATPLVRIGRKIYGNTATAIANMTDDGTGNGTLKVESILITNPGMNFTAAEPVAISGGDPTTPAVPPALSVATNASGGLTKLGLGTLTLLATNTYTGDTIVNGGTLAIACECLADEADVRIAGNAKFAIEFDGEDVIRGLFYNDVSLPKGKYYSGALGGTIAGGGLGYLKVTGGPPAGLQLLVR